MAYECTPEEKKLVDGCLKGNPKDQKRLYEKHYGKMLGICQRYTTNRDEALDMLQDGFVKVFRNLPAFSFQCPLEAWIRKIMINTAIDAYRKGNAHQLSFDIENAAEVTSGDDVISEMSHRELLGCLHLLPPGYKLVFNMYIIEGYTHREIAESLGISEGTSKSQLAKAKVYLQKIIAKQLTSENE